MNTPVSRTAFALGVLTVLFAARVVGQAMVAYLDVTWLPPMEAWYSGLLPYPVLLPMQLVILLVQVMIGRDVRRGRGFFSRPRPRAGRALQWLAVVYALAMIVRYAVMRSHPIPIVFHWVLAAYLFTLGRSMRPECTGAMAATLRSCAIAGGPEPSTASVRSGRTFVARTRR